MGSEVRVSTHTHVTVILDGVRRYSVEVVGGGGLKEPRLCLVSLKNRLYKMFS